MACAVPVTVAPAATIVRPVTIATRRGTASTTRPISGADNVTSSPIASATPIRPSDTPSPAAIVARNGAAKRYTVLPAKRANASSPTLARTSGAYESSSSGRGTSINGTGGLVDDPADIVSAPWH